LAAGCSAPLGRAETRDADEGSGDDPRGLQPARAIRRALADAGLKAADVEAVWACFDRRAFADAARRARAAIELGLGSDAAQVALIDVRPASADGLVSAELAAARCRLAVARGDIRTGLSVAIAVGGRNVAIAWGRPR
jgi:hypothetical protein